MTCTGNRLLTAGLLTVACCWPALAQTRAPEAAKSPLKEYHNQNYLVVTPEGPKDGGDFGPGTPGTRTSGIQEALDYAKAHHRDLYIAGGGFTEAFKGGVAYSLATTLRVPWMQQFRLDGGEYQLHYTPKDGDAVVIDSQMNCRLKFGLIVNQQSDGAVVRIAPTSKGPDNACCCVASSFEFNGMVGAGDVWGKSSSQKSTALVLDATKGGITGNKFSILEINACRRGIYVMNGAGNNTIEAQWIHLTNLGIQLGDPQGAGVWGNRITAGISGDIPNTTGLQVFGLRNTLMVDVYSSDPQRALVLEEPARENLILSAHLVTGYINRATSPTNRLIAPVAIPEVQTPSVPVSGQEVRNGNLCPVEVRILTPGKVLQWTEIDAQGKPHLFPGSFAAGQSFTLNPGERLQLTYEQAPTWFWKGL